MNRIKECRLEKKLTLRQLSDELAEYNLIISPDALSKYERGECEPKLKTYEKLASVFGVSVGYLMGLSDKSVGRNGRKTFIKELGRFIAAIYDESQYSEECIKSYMKILQRDFYFDEEGIKLLDHTIKEYTLFYHRRYRAKKIKLVKKLK